MPLRPNTGQGHVMLGVGLRTYQHPLVDHTQPCATIARTPVDEWSARHTDSTGLHTTYSIDTHAPGGIRIRVLSGWEVEFLRLRQRGYWDRPKNRYTACEQAVTSLLVYIYIYLFIYVYTQQYSTIVSNYNLLFSAWRHVSPAHAAIFRPA